MIQLIIFCVFTIAFFSNFKKTFVVMMVINTWIRCFSFSVVTDKIDMFDAVSLMGFALSFIFCRFKSIYTWKNPFSISICIIILSKVISNVFGVYHHTPSMMIQIVELLNIFIFCHIIMIDKKYIKTFVRTCVVLGTIISCYAIYETVTGLNPYIVLVNDLNLYASDKIITDVRFFLKRSQSVFSMHTTSGTMMYLLAFVLFYLKRYTVVLDSYRFVGLISWMLVVGAFLSGTRSAIAGCVVSLMAFVSFHNFRYIIAAVFIVLAAYFFLPEYLEMVYHSFTDTESVGGSSSTMRDMQFTLAIYFFMKSPLVGNGLGFTWEYVKLYYDKELLGAESLWIPIMIDQGILGILSYVVFVLSAVFYVIRRKCARLSFLIVALLITNTLSSIPDVDIIYLSVFIIPLAEWVSDKKYGISRLHEKAIA